MLKHELIRIKLRKNLIKHYSNLGYEIKDEIDVFSEHLHKGSGAVITVICDNCQKEIKLKYKNYYESTIRNNSLLYYCKKCKYCRIKETNLEKYGVENVMQVKYISDKMVKTQNKLDKKRAINDKKYIINKYGTLENYYNLINEKKKKTCLEKYGVENVMLVDDIKKKGQSTCFDRYGEINPMFVNEFIEKSTIKSVKTKIKKNLIISEDKLTEFEKYKRITRRLIYKYKEELFSNWNGYDYYDNEYIKENLNLHHLDKKYPTIDHKISIFQGFIDNIDPYIIGDIKNMCITKREINSSKHFKIKPSQKYLKT